MKPTMLHCLLQAAFFTLFGQANVNAQSGPSTLTGPGITFQADYMPASNYIRPEDSLKMPANSAVRRLSMAAAFSLYNRVDTATGKIRIWNLALAGSYMTFSNKLYEKNVMPTELAGGTVAVQHIRNLNRRWSIMTVLSAGVYTDMVSITAKDVFLNGGVLFIKQQSPRFSWGLGGVLTNTFGAPMILPAVMVKWTNTGRFNIQAGIPEGIAASYRVNRILETGLGVRLNGGSYDVEHQPAHQRLMAYKEITAGLENTIHLNKYVSFSVSGGYALLRSVDYREKSLASIFSTRPEHRLAGNWFANAGVRVNFTR